MSSVGLPWEQVGPGKYFACICGCFRHAGQQCDAKVQLGLASAQRIASTLPLAPASPSNIAAALRLMCLCLPLAAPFACREPVEVAAEFGLLPPLLK